MFRTRRARTPVILQMEAVECGAAALASVLAYHRLYVPLSEMRVRCGVSRDGSRASRMAKAARELGMTARGLTRTIPSLAELKPPFIVFWQFNHFLIVEGMTRSKVFVNDPAQGHRVLTPREFDEGYTGVVLVVEPGPEFRRGGSPPRPLRNLLRATRGVRAPLAFATIAGLLGHLPALALVGCTAVFLDEVLGAGRLDWVRPIVLLVVGCAATAAVLQWFRAAATRHAQVAFGARLSAHFVAHLLRLPLMFFTTRGVGELGYRSQLALFVAGSLGPSLATCAVAVGGMTLYAAAMAGISPLLAAAVVALASSNFVALKLAARRRADLNLRATRDAAEAAGVGVIGIQAAEPLKASGLEDGFFAKWAGYESKSVASAQELERLNLALSALPLLLTGLAASVALAVGGHEAVGGSLTVGSLVAFLLIARMFFRPLELFAESVGTLQSTTAALHRLDDVLSHPPIAEPRGEGEPRRLAGRIDAAGVTFGYSRSDPPTVENIDVHVAPGRWVAFVGGSGSGKSTAARLLAGLFEPWAGEVRYDGVAVAELHPETLPMSLGFVDQGGAIFEGTVRENLALWDDGVPDERLLRACRDAKAGELVASLPGGLGAELLEGGDNLSGGQRQRLELARALVRDPSVLILDEATSALDADNELEVFRNLRRRGCACVVVAHRLSTIRDCDEILVFDAGRVVERGRHLELIALGGRYAALVGGVDQ